MLVSNFQFPSLEELGMTLAAVLDVSDDGPVTIVDRWLDGYASSHPMEILAYRIGRGTEKRLLVKYGGLFRRGKRLGCYRTVSYEAEVYKRVLSLSSSSLPAFLGVSGNEQLGSSDAWLLIEYLYDGMRISELGDARVQEDAVMEGARWLGRFHAEFETRFKTEIFSFLRALDENYYVNWAKQTSLALKPLRLDFPWLPGRSSDFEKLCSRLQSGPATVIYGDFYAYNLLFQSGSVYPVDWESAAVGLGEIDLASLTEGWDEGTMQESQLAYQQARWPAGAPAQSEDKLDAARLYWHFRWLMQRRNQGNKDLKTTLLWRLDEVRRLGKKSGLI